MKYYIQFYDKAPNKDYTGEALGTDAVHRVDGRLSLYNMRMQGFKRAKQLVKIRKYYGFKVFRCHSLRDKPVFLTDMVVLNYETSVYLKTGR